MATTSRLGLYQPIGTLKATATASGTTTTFLCSNADATNLVADSTTVYRIYEADLDLKEDTNLVVTNKQVDVPSAGTTTVTISPALSNATANLEVLYRPEVVNVTTALTNQLQTLDDKWEAFSCTSSTRPGSPFTGMLIWETDTEEIHHYDGAAWQFVSTPKRARGYMASTSRTSASATIAPADGEVDLGFETTFSASPLRSYKILMHMNWDRITGTLANSPYITVKLRYAAGGSVTTSGTLIAEYVQDVTENTAGNTQRGVYVAHFAPNVATDPTTLTVGAFVTVNTASTSIQMSAVFAQLTILDIGEL